MTTKRKRIQGTGLIVSSHQPPPSDEMLRAERTIQAPGTWPLPLRSHCPKCGSRRLAAQPVLNERGLHEGDLWDWNCFCGWTGDTFRRPRPPRPFTSKPLHRYV